MRTLYELFKVSEDATVEEITANYNRIIEKSKALPQTEQLIKQIQKINIAYGILSNDDKRKKYDLDLANKRAESLLNNIRETNIELEKVSSIELDEERIKQSIEEQINSAINEQEMNEIKTKMTKNTLKKTEKAQQKLERKNRKIEKREQQYKREQEIYEYGAYLEKQGYKVEYPWTWLRIKRLLISFITVVIVLIVFWNIPFVRKILVDLYENNFVIKSLVNIIISIINGIVATLKSVF